MRIFLVLPVPVNISSYSMQLRFRLLLLPLPAPPSNCCPCPCPPPPPPPALLGASSDINGGGLPVCVDVGLWPEVELPASELMGGVRFCGLRRFSCCSSCSLKKGQFSSTSFQHWWRKLYVLCGIELMSLSILHINFTSRSLMPSFFSRAKSSGFLNGFNASKCIKRSRILRLDTSDILLLPLPPPPAPPPPPPPLMLPPIPPPADLAMPLRELLLLLPLSILLLRPLLLLLPIDPPDIPIPIPVVLSLGELPLSA